jgi:hypothetical protein
MRHLSDPAATTAPHASPSLGELDEPTAAFYRHVLENLNLAGAPFLVGGAYAFACYTGIARHTKDLDLFLRRSDYERVTQVLKEAGYDSELPYPHWLGKVHQGRGGDAFVDLIFSAGNGVAAVDDRWFEHAAQAEVLGIPVRIVPPEEMMWSKGFIMERERFDGADVAHLIRARAEHLDWARLLERFGDHWRVLLSHLVLFGFIYPAERERIPAGVMASLLQRLQHDTTAAAKPEAYCGGTLLSREQYLYDIEHLGLRDARMQPLGAMTPQEVDVWTRAIPGRDGGPPRTC